ncbi:anaphase-promoting complex subunit 16-like [Actinia tenebrosa]|uniref:Anaphase-promoting complex subunit 16-like n=1 Tax=Actinia tenebrosa TaxID=6105 RepID=A0A6P8HJX2_ACTTE|nr:anaphase-promoting complex subunit 16-like [Actinia tenebrosa]
MAASSGGLRKALFRSPPTVETPSKNPEALESLLNKIQVDIEVDNNLNSLKREMHEQRMAKLRQELEHISQDQWKYKPIDQLIGF